MKRTQVDLNERRFRLGTHQAAGRQSNAQTENNLKLFTETTKLVRIFFLNNMQDEGQKHAEEAEGLNMEIEDLQRFTQRMVIP